MAWRPAEGLLAVLNRFSRAAVVVVGVLVLTGLALAIVQLESFGALIETRYGIILSIKLALVVSAARPCGAQPLSPDAGARR